MTGLGIFSQDAEQHGIFARLLVQFMRVRTGATRVHMIYLQYVPMRFEITMAKSKTGIDPSSKWGGRFGPIHPLLRSLQLMDCEYAAYYRMFLLSVVCWAVGTGLLWWAAESRNLEPASAGMSLFVLGEIIWVGIGAVLIWKLMRVVIDRCRAGRRGVLDKGNSQIQSDR